MKWYMKLILALGGTFALAVLLIMFGQEQAGDIVWQQAAPGTKGQASEYVVELPATMDCVLTVKPFSASVRESEPDGVMKNFGSVL